MGRGALTYDQAYSSLVERWNRLVDRSAGVDECWPWTGYINPQTGYGQITTASALREAGWQRTLTAPWASCRIHNGPPVGEGRVDVLHSCGEHDCCNPSHLRWGSHAQNMQDRVLNGRQNTGKIDAEQVRSIRREFANRSTGKMVAYEHIAEKYGICSDMVRTIIGRRAWGWLDD